MSPGRARVAARSAWRPPRWPIRCRRSGVLERAGHGAFGGEAAVGSGARELGGSAVVGPLTQADSTYSDDEDNHLRSFGSAAAKAACMVRWPSGEDSTVTRVSLSTIAHMKGRWRRPRLLTTIAYGCSGSLCRIAISHDRRNSGPAGGNSSGRWRTVPAGSPLHDLPQPSRRESRPRSLSGP
jgi:hypothetical protein